MSEMEEVQRHRLLTARGRCPLLKEFAGTFLTFILLFVVPNVFFKLASEYLGVGRPVFNFDYAASALLLLCQRRNIAILALILFSVIDIFTLVSQLFPFLRLTDAFYLIKFFNIAPGSYLTYSFLGLLAIVLSAYSFFIWHRHVNHRASAAVLINLFLLFYVAGLYDQSGHNKYYRLSDDRLLMSLTVYQVDTRSSGFLDKFNEDVAPLQPGKYDSAFGLNVEKYLPSDKVLLIVSESWGVSVSEEIQEKILSPILSDPQVQVKLTSIDKGALDFSGATVDGELRELCGLSTANFNLRNVQSGFEDCVPWKFRQHGYKSVAFHGAVGSMYDRAFWYPKAGFSEAIFYDTMQWDSRCYSFPGTCDYEVLNKITETINERDKVFAYWLTLNTHAIYDKRDLFHDGFDCESYKVEPETQSCRNFELHTQFFHNLSVAIKKGLLSGTEVIVVGDHAPPIFNQNEKDKYFISGMVPWMSFSVN